MIYKRQDPNREALSTEWDDTSSGTVQCDFCLRTGVKKRDVYRVLWNNKPTNTDLCTSISCGKGITWDAIYALLWKKGKITEPALKSDSSSMPTMSLSAIAKRVLDPKYGKLVKAGFMDSELQLTSEGRRELEAMFLSEYIDKLVTAAEEVIAERKEEKCG